MNKPHRASADTAASPYAARPWLEHYDYWGDHT